MGNHEQPRATKGDQWRPGATLGEQWQPLLGRRLYAPGGLLAVAHGGPWWPMVAHWYQRYQGVPGVKSSLKSFDVTLNQMDI